MGYRNTTKVPDTLLREVIRFVDPGLTKFSIWFKNYRPARREAIGFCGCAYYHRMHVVARIPRYQRLKKPYDGGGLNQGRGYIAWGARTYEEALVCLVAHELNHLAQYLNPTLYRRTPGARGQFSERDCDTYAIRKMMEWRAAKGGTTDAPAKLRTLAVKPFTPRQRLRMLADSCGCEIEFGDPSPDCIWVGPPTPLCAADGVMDNDPYDDAHYHYDYHSAKEAIETYARLVEEKTLVATRVNTSIAQIGLDNAREGDRVVA